MTASSLRNLLEALEGHPLSDDVYSARVLELSQLEDDTTECKSIQLVSLEGRMYVCLGVVKTEKVNT